MANINFSCPHCSHTMHLPVELVGRKGKCPKCQTEILVSTPPEERRVEQPNPISHSEQPISSQPAPDGSTPASHRGVLILILAVVGMFSCVLGVVLGPITIMMSSRDLKQMKLGAMEVSGQGKTKLGRLFGIIATITGLLSVACAILVATGVFVTANFSGIRSGSKENAAKIQLESLGNSLEFYHLDVGQYPPDNIGLDCLLVPPEDTNLALKWRGPYLNVKSIPADPWGADYQYVLDSDPVTHQTGFRIWSDGADLVTGTDDDITFTSF